MKITKELINKLKGYDCVLSPAVYDPQDKARDKKPCSKKGSDGQFHWSEDWSDEELLKAKRLGMFHEPSSTYDVDFDDKSFTAHKFSPLLPPTFSIGKEINGVPTTTHKIYRKTNAAKVARWSYPKSVLNGSGKIIERLNKFTVLADQDRIITNDVKPVAADPEEILIKLKMIAAFAELYKHWPKKEGQRDDAHFELAGFLASETDVPLDVKQQFVKHLCVLTGDTEIDNRVNKLEYQELQFKKDPKQVYGIKSLATRLGVNLPACDILKIDNVEEKEYPLINASMDITYPPTRFIMEPIFTERSTNQIYGEPESGKTLAGMACGINMSSGHDFIGFKSIQKVPVLYVEGELAGKEFTSRKDTIVNGLVERGKNFNSKWFYYLTRDDLEMHGFKYGFDPIAVSRNLSDKDAIDYGIQGRKLIESLVQRIEKEIGVKPFFFLDNITALADIDENRAQDWTPLIQWTTHMKSKGYSNCFDHHSNKHTGTSSGSGAKERLLDTSIKFEKLMPDQRFEMIGNKNLQCRVKFTKSRNFGGGQWDKPFILTMDEMGKFTKYPNLVKDDFIIIELWKQKISVKEMEDDPRLKIKEKTIYKHITKLKKWEIIK